MPEKVNAETLSLFRARGKWAIRQIARHLTDTEIVAGMPSRHTIAENGPPMTVVDQIGLHPERGAWTLRRWSRQFGLRAESQVPQKKRIRKAWKFH